MKNIKIIMPIILFIASVIGGYLYWQSIQSDTKKEIVTSSGQTITVPERSAEINGTVLQVEGNELLVRRVISTLTEEEQAQKKALMQTLTQEERQAQRGQEQTTAQTEDVTVIVPVGVPIVITSGDMSETMKEASLLDIKVGGNVSIWKSDLTVEFVKIKGI